MYSRKIFFHCLTQKDSKSTNIAMLNLYLFLATNEEYPEFSHPNISIDDRLWTVRKQGHIPTFSYNPKPLDCLRIENPLCRTKHTSADDLQDLSVSQPAPKARRQII